jgi:hypothetical protein
MMPVRTFLIAALTLLVACGERTEASAAAAAQGLKLDPAVWGIGPIIRGRNYSVGMPLHPARSREGGLAIDLPRAPASVHYVTFPHGSLAGKRRIVMRFRIEAAPGVRIVPTTAPGSPSALTLYFQRRGDNWSGRRAYETYRWYATFATLWDLKPGSYEMVAPLGAKWTAVETSTAANAPGAFRAAVAEAGEVGFVLGGGDGYGHGVHATGRARLVVTSFRVE